MTNPRDYALPDPSLDPEAQRIAWERDRNERGWRHMMGSARQAGHEEGIEIGRQEKAAMLAQLLAKKFGPLAEAQRERVEGADGATLKRWFEAFLDAVSIDDLLRQ
jgi:hypothetical protein